MSTHQKLAVVAGSGDVMIPIELAGNTQLVLLSRVRYIQACSDYSRLHVDNGATHLLRIPLSALEQAWPEFVRIHRSYLARLSLLGEMRWSGSECMVGVGDVELPVGRRRVTALRTRLAGAA